MTRPQHHGPRPAEYRGNAWTVTPCSAEPGQLSEGPRWDATRGELLWVDVLAGSCTAAVPARRPAPGAADHPDPGPPRRRGPRAGGGCVLAAGPGFLHPDRVGAVRELAQPEAGRTDVRMNDGTCDPQRRFWAGTMAYDEAPSAGCLYRLELDGTCTRVLDGLTISNGIGWSPDGRTMYLADSGTRDIDAFDFDPATGNLSRRHTIVHITTPGAVPDGLTVDDQADIWVALWNGGRSPATAPAGNWRSLSRSRGPAHLLRLRRRGRRHTFRHQRPGTGSTTPHSPGSPTPAGCCESISPVSPARRVSSTACSRQPPEQRAERGGSASGLACTLSAWRVTGDIPVGTTGRAAAQRPGSGCWRRHCWARLLLRPVVALIGHLGVSHSDRDAQRPKDLPACRDHPGRAHHRGNRDHDCLNVVGGHPAVRGGPGVGEVGGRRCIHSDQGGHPRERELARDKRVVLDRCGGEVGECVKDRSFGSHRALPRLLRNARLLATRAVCQHSTTAPDQGHHPRW